MKNALVVIALMFTLGNAFAQSLTETTLSPLATATRIVQSGTATALIGPLASTLASAQNRGVAGKEQLKDELVALNDDLVSGKVQEIGDVRQPALRELFEEIAANESQMADINSVIDSGSELHRIATAVTVALLLE